MDNETKLSDARCGFCDGPMPCYCPNPLTESQQIQVEGRDEEAQNNADLPCVDS